MATKLKFEGVFAEERGEWVADYTRSVEGVQKQGYGKGDVVHTGNGVYRSNISDNTSNPDEDKENKWSTWLDKQPLAEAVDKVNQFMVSWSADNRMIGFSRPKVSSDPAGTLVFGTKQLVHEVGKHLRLMTVGIDGVPTHIMEGGRLTKATDGSAVAIDGSEGDVVLAFDVPVHFLRGNTDVEGVSTNCCAIGLTPASWQEFLSKPIDSFGFSPCSTVLAKLTGDLRNQQHCIYNTSAVGKYSTPSAIFKTSYQTSGGGLCSLNISAVNNIMNAQAKNEVATTNFPWVDWFHDYYEVMIVMMSAELGTFAHNRLDLFGVGCTASDTVNANTFNDEAISANSGFKIFKGDGNIVYQNWHNACIKPTSSDTAVALRQGINGAQFNPVGMLEGQRVLDAIAAAGLIPYMGSRNNIFTYAADGTMTVITDGSVNVETGEGMVAAKHYFIVRNVPGCEGMSDGVMTAVVNSYTKLEFADDAVYSDNVTLSGSFCICKRSIPIYRGWTLPYVGHFVQVGGAYYGINKDANGVITMDYVCCPDIKDWPARSATPGYQVAYGKETPLEQGCTLRKKYPANLGNEGWIKSCDYNISLMCGEAMGGGMRTYENMYLWVYPSNNGGTNTRQLHGSVVGCSSSSSAASARTEACNANAGYGADVYAGAFAVRIQKAVNG